MLFTGAKIVRYCRFIVHGIGTRVGRSVSYSSMASSCCKNEKGPSSISEKLDLVKKNIKSYPDFPKEGILFRDVFSVLNNPVAASALSDLITAHVKSLPQPIDAVLGLEARGFLFGPQIAATLGSSFVPIRKKGKLPGEKARVEYSLEYGNDIIEIQKESVVGKKKILIVDDLLATGGTMKAACDLAKLCNLEVVECFVIMELADLKGRSKLPVPCHALISYD